MKLSISVELKPKDPNKPGLGDKLKSGLKKLAAASPIQVTVKSEAKPAPEALPSEG